MHSFHKVHNVGKAAVQCNDHAFGKLYISLTEADILPAMERGRGGRGRHTKTKQKKESHIRAVSSRQLYYVQGRAPLFYVYKLVCMKEAFFQHSLQTAFQKELPASQDCSRQKKSRNTIRHVLSTTSFVLR